MKRLIILFLAAVSVASCDSSTHRHTVVVQGKDDLLVTPELQKVFALRRESVKDTVGEGLLMLRSDYGFDGGRHEYRAAGNFRYLTGYAQPGTIMSLTGTGPDGYTIYARQRSIRDIIYSGSQPDPGLLKDIGPSLAEMRVHKDSYEVKMLQAAVDITGLGIEQVLHECRPGNRLLSASIPKEPDEIEKLMK